MDGLENQTSSLPILTPFLSETGPALVALWKAQLEWCFLPSPTGGGLEPVGKIADVFKHLENLEKDWDSYGGEPPTPLAIATARRLVWDILSRVFPLVGERAVPYTAVPLSGGGVQVEWRNGQDGIEVEIGPRGSLGYLVIRRAGAQRRFEERDEVPEPEIASLVVSVIL